MNEQIQAALVLKPQEVDAAERELDDWHNGTNGIEDTRLIVMWGRFLATIRDRDKTIAELSRAYEAQFGAYKQFLEQQNQLMLSALELAQQLLGEWMAIPYRRSFILTHDIASELSEAVDGVISKVKALSVSRQGETSDTSVASEQP